MTSLAGPKILIEGASGSGKTWSLGTLADWAARQSPPFHMHVIFTENGLETLLGYYADKGKPVPECLHWHVIRTPAVPFESLMKAATDTGKLTYELLTKMVDPNRSTNNPWEKFLTVLTDVPCDRTGKKFGNVAKWDPASFILVNDSLSETAIACFKMVTGNKLTAAPSEYQVAQNNLIGWLRWMTQTLQCTFVVTAHIERRIDELSQSTKIMTKTMIGKALNDDIPQLFSEAILAERAGAAWHWNLAMPNVDTKTRYLPIEAKISPDFGLIMDKWKKRAEGAKS